MKIQKLTKTNWEKWANFHLKRIIKHSETLFCQLQMVVYSDGINQDLMLQKTKF